MEPEERREAEILKAWTSVVVGDIAMKGARYYKRSIDYELRRKVLVGL